MVNLIKKAAIDKRNKMRKNTTVPATTSSPILKLYMYMPTNDLDQIKVMKKYTKMK